MSSFSEVPIRPGPAGATMLAEFGLGPEAQRDLLVTCGDTLDFAKIVVGIAGLIPLPVLREKVAIYREYGVAAFPGGMFLEHAVARDAVAGFFAGVLEAGFHCVEVSENARPLTGSTKAELIDTALGHGLAVLGEVGSKHTTTDAAELVEQARFLLGRGCAKVLVEAAELLDGQDGGSRLREELVKRIEGELPLADVVFELPGPWLPGVHRHEVHALQRRLVHRFGPAVNLANVQAGDVLFVEAMRRGIGPDA